MNKPVSLRLATSKDAETIFKWRNDPFILERSSSRKVVSWEEHQTWVNRVVSDPDILMFIIQWADDPVGLLRYEFTSESRSCVVSVYVLEKFTGHGIGLQALAKGSDEVWRKWPAERIVAHVRSDNAAGQKAFEKAGFVLVKNPSDCPPLHVEYVYGRKQ